MSDRENISDDAGAGPQKPVGLLARFDGPEALLAAAARLRDAGFRRWDAMSPFPIHGMERAMGIRPTRLPWLVLAAGIAGAIAALALQWWTNAVDYPMRISGKPMFSLPADIPVIFELIILFSALAAFFGALGLNRLPQFWHPAFGAAKFARATTDGFFIFVEAGDEKFEESAVRRLLESLGATGVEPCFEASSGRDFPRATVWIAAAAIALAVLPPLWIARTRLVKSSTPRLDIFSDMDFQPKCTAQAASAFFADGRAARLPVPGTVGRGGLEADAKFYRGKAGDQFVATFPMAPTRAMIERGRQRFDIYCATCHGWTGEGGPNGGMTDQRAIKLMSDPQAGKPSGPTWVMPTSLQGKEVREQPVGQIFQTITSGIRTMPSYAAQIPPEDRWAIILYLRALQRSQNASLEDVPEDKRKELR